MTEKEEKRKAFFEKANANKENFDSHRDLIEAHLCSGNKMYYEDLRVFAERQVIDNMLLLKLMEYAEAYHKIKSIKPVYTQNDLPFPSKDDVRYSVDVFVRLDGMFNVAFFDFESKVWSFHTDTLIDPEGKDFIWMYPNNEFLTHTGAVASNCHNGLRLTEGGFLENLVCAAFVRCCYTSVKNI